MRHSHTLLLLSNSLYLPHRWNRPIIKAKERENLNRLPLEFYGSLEGPPPLHPLLSHFLCWVHVSTNFRFYALLVTNHYPTCISFLNHRVRTCRAMGSRLKSQESPTESSNASSIAFNCEAYSSKNWPYFLSCASPTISAESKGCVTVYEL